MCDESTIAALLTDLETLAWNALCAGDDDLAESANCELIAARADYADLLD